MTLGVDYSASPPNPAHIAAAGYTFVLRYLSLDPAKNLTAREAEALLAAGLDVGVVWETTAQRALAGGPAGAPDGAEAKRQAEAAGAPPASAIYFAVDFDAAPSHMPAIDAYAAAFAAAIAPHPAGVYGSGFVCNQLARLPYRWQSMSTGWRQSSTAQPGVCLWQRRGALVDGVPCDVNDRLAPFGGWRSNPSMPAPPVFSHVEVTVPALKSALYPPPPLNAQGVGWYPDPLPIPFAAITGDAIIQGSNPDTDGSVWAAAAVMMQDRDGGTQITYRKLSEGTTPGFTIRWLDLSA